MLAKMVSHREIMIKAFDVSKAKIKLDAVEHSKPFWPLAQRHCSHFLAYLAAYCIRDEWREWKKRIVSSISDLCWSERNKKESHPSTNFKYLLQNLHKWQWLTILFNWKLVNRSGYTLQWGIQVDALIHVGANSEKS